MTLDLEKYTWTDGQTALSAAELNGRFYAIVRRLHALEILSIDWSAAVSEVQNYGLARINDAVKPLIDSLQQDLAALIASGQADLANQSTAVAAKLAEVDAKMTVVEARISAAEAEFAAASAAVNAHAARSDNPHSVTAAQAGAVPIASLGQPGGVATLGDDGHHIPEETLIRSAGDCYLSWTNSATLTLNREKGKWLTIDNIPREIPIDGVTLSASGTVVNTLYFIYAYLESGQMKLMYSTSVSTVDSRNGTRVMTGDSSKTLVGMAYIITAGQWTDSTIARCVLSYFNRRTRFAYVNSTANIVSSSTTFTPTGYTLNFLSWGDCQDLTQTVFFQSYNSSAASNDYVGAYVDGVDNLDAVCSHTSANISGAGYATWIGLYGIGRHYASLYTKTSNGQATFEAGAYYSILLRG